uniref:Uncharacterized protein n=1 Tax=Romanomermis culicivorax TaxID=13658 RepID=A0A915KFW4_ROMCU
MHDGSYKCKTVCPVVALGASWTVYIGQTQHLVMSTSRIEALDLANIIELLMEQQKAQMKQQKAQREEQKVQREEQRLQRQLIFHQQKAQQALMDHVLGQNAGGTRGPTTGPNVPSFPPLEKTQDHWDTYLS